MKATISSALAMLHINLRTLFSQRASFWLQAGMMCLNNFMFLAVWWLLLRKVDNIHGWRMREILLLYAIVAIAFGLERVFAGGVTSIAHKIEDGELDGLLTQPKPVLLQLITSRSEAAAVGDLISAGLMLWLAGGVDGWSWLMLPIAGVCGALVFLATELMIHSAAFWFGEMRALSRQVPMFLITLSLYPTSIHGWVMRVVLFTLMPAGFLGALPWRVIVEGDPLLLLALIGAATGYMLLAIWVFQRGLRRYASGSRFTVTGVTG